MKIQVQLSLAACLSTAAWCGLIVQAEDPGVQQTSVAGASTYDFEDLSLGLHSDVVHNFGSITGTYNQLDISGPNVFGGANESNYPNANFGIGGISTYSLTLSESVNYFGMWWAAGDGSNLLEFYLGDTKVAQYLTATAMGALPGSYYGNPNTGENGAEPYAYLDFYGTDGTVFDKIVFTTTSSCCGFESDNHAVVKSAVPGGGTNVSDVPEPSTFALIGSAIAGLAILRHRV